MRVDNIEFEIIKEEYDGWNNLEIRHPIGDGLYSVAINYTENYKIEGITKEGKKVFFEKKEYFKKNGEKYKTEFFRKNEKWLDI